MKKILVREAISVVSALIIGVIAVFGFMFTKSDSYADFGRSVVSFKEVMSNGSAEFSEYAHYSLVDTSYEPAEYLYDESSVFISGLDNDDYSCLSKNSALFDSIFVLNRMSFVGGFTAGNKEGSNIINFKVYSVNETLYLSAQYEIGDKFTESVYKCSDKSVYPSLADFDVKNGFSRYASHSYKVWQNFYNPDMRAEELIKDIFIIFTAVSFVVISIILNIKTISAFIKSRLKKEKNAGNKKSLSKKVEAIIMIAGGISLIFVLSMAIFLIVCEVDNAKSRHMDKIYEEQSIWYYKDMNDKVKMKDYHELDNTLLCAEDSRFKHTLFKYYIDKQECYSVKDYNNKQFFFGPNERDAQLSVRFIKGFDDSEWFIRNDYTLPDIKIEEIQRIVIVGISNLESEDPDDELRCVSFGDEGGNVEYIHNRDKIDECVSKFQSGNYYFEDLKVCAPAEKSDYYLVLAQFEDSVVYQCLGYFDV